MKSLLLILLLGAGTQYLSQTRSEISKPTLPPAIDGKVQNKDLGADPSVEEPHVRGRVRDFWGRSISRATISVFCLDCEDVLVGRTNMFGYYKIEGLRMGSSYLISIRHGKHLFTSPSVSFTVNAVSTSLNFETGP